MWQREARYQYTINHFSKCIMAIITVKMAYINSNACSSEETSSVTDILTATETVQIKTDTQKFLQSVVSVTLYHQMHTMTHSAEQIKN